MDNNFTSGEMVHSSNHVQQGGFTRPGFADHAQELGRIDGRVNTSQCRKIARSGLVYFVDLAEFDECFGLLGGGKNF
jgi:hypothetical protein